jgi:DNA-binding FrmR family transcriptional regulator
MSTSSSHISGRSSDAPAGSVIRADDLRPIVNRLRRAEGQLSGVIRMLEEGRDCNDVLPQLSAVNKALSKAGFAIVASSLQECLAHPDSDGTTDIASLEKLFLSLA